MSVPDEIQVFTSEPQAQPGEHFQQAEILHITTPEQLKAISDPLRMNILEAIFEQAHTVKQIADRLNQPPTRLYYHVNELEAVGFVALVETRVKSGIVEKYYRAAGRTFQVDRKLLALQPDNLQSVFAAVFDPTMEELARSLAEGLIAPADGEGTDPTDLVVSRVVCRLKKSDVTQFVQRLKALLVDLGENQAGAEDESLESYACTIAFYPRPAGAKQEN